MASHPRAARWVRAAPHDTNTTVFPSRDGRRPPALPSCPVPLQRFASPITASDLANCPQNRLPVCRLSRAGDEISRGNREVDRQRRVEEQIVRQQKKPSSYSQEQTFNAQRPTSNAQFRGSLRRDRLSTL